MPVSVVVALGSVSIDLVMVERCRFGGLEQAVQSEPALCPAELPGPNRRREDGDGPKKIGSQHNDRLCSAASDRLILRNLALLVVKASETKANHPP